MLWERTVKHSAGLFFVIVFVFVATYGLAKARNQFDGSLQTDPVYHNLSVVATKTIPEFITMVASQSQPLLEYTLRRVFFFPLFGENERAIKLPSMLSYGLILILLPWLSFNLLKQSAQSRLPALLLSMAILVWGASNPLLLQYSVEGRHYEWCALVSLFWFWLYFQEDFSTRTLFHVCSWIYLNSHFFVWPLVASAYALALIESYRAQKKGAGPKIAGWGLCVGITSLFINWNAIYTLFVGDPALGASGAAGSANGIRGSMLSSFSLARTFRSVFEIKPLLLGASVVGACLLKQYKLILSLLVLIFSLLMIRSSSSYSFSPRYFLPFFGLAWAVLAVACQTSIFVLKRVSSGSKRFAHASAALFAIGVFSFLIWLNSQSPLATLKAAFEKGVPKENFSDEFFEYEKIKALRDPSIVIGKGAYPYTLTLWYLRDQSKETPHVRSLSQDVYHVNTWKTSWVEFKQKNPAGKTFVHFYTESLCESADPQTFHELKRFSEGCIGEIIAADSVDKLERFFSKSRGTKLTPQSV